MSFLILTSGLFENQGLVIQKNAIGLLSFEEIRPHLTWLVFVGWKCQSNQAKS